jgi:hypothetical protein
VLGKVCGAEGLCSKPNAVLEFKALGCLAVGFACFLSFLRLMTLQSSYLELCHQ